ncbi:MAG: tyrosine-type recombinase/integrase [Phycisphaerae bacterium]
MARKENQWIKSERAGKVTLFVTPRSPYWQMYWIDGHRTTKGGKKHPIEFKRSTRETDLSLARIIAGRKNEELYKQREFPAEHKRTRRQRNAIRETATEFISYLQSLDRSHDHIKNIRGRLGYLCDWMEQNHMRYVQQVNPSMLQVFLNHLVQERGVSPSTANAYLDAVHNFFGYVIFKRKLVRGTNPAATGRQAELDRLPRQTVRPPTIYPEQINEIIRVARSHNDTQTINLVVFVCEGGFRFQELQFLQVGDIDLDRREITLDVKRLDLRLVRPELRRRCLTPDGRWVPKSRASRRPIHVTDQLLRVINSMGLGGPSDWVFVNSVDNQIAENKTLQGLKAHAVEADVLVEAHPRTGKPWSTIKWHWLRHYHRTRAHVSGIRREVSKLAMGHAADPIHDHYRGVDVNAFHAEYAKFDSGIDGSLLVGR